MNLSCLGCGANSLKNFLPSPFFDPVKYRFKITQNCKFSHTIGSDTVFENLLGAFYPNKEEKGLGKPISRKILNLATGMKNHDYRVDLR